MDAREGLAQGFRADGSAVIAEWIDTFGNGAVCAWVKDDRAVLQWADDGDAIVWAPATEHDAWARETWARMPATTGAPGVGSVARDEVLMCDYFGCFDMGRADGVELMVIHGAAIAVRPLMGADADAALTALYA